jgi:hypothetical protein
MATDDPSKGTENTRAGIRGLRVRLALMGLAVVVALGAVTAILWQRAAPPQAPAVAEAPAAADCEIRVLVEEKGETHWYKFSPQDRSPSEVDFEPGTAISKLQIEGCVGAPLTPGSD